MAKGTATVFLSYAREDLVTAKRLEQALRDNQHSVWRDQESVYAGQNWPKAIGNAIDAKDAVVLLWSTQAKRAHFVEFEWSTAIALKRPILPCLLDETSLPPSLSSYNAVSINNFEADFPKILKSLQRLSLETDPNHSVKVLEQLDDMSSAKPKEAVKAVRKIIKQQVANVSGDVYQAGGDISVRIDKREESPLKRVLEKWHYIVAILVGILTVVQITRKEFSCDTPSDIPGNTVLEEQIIAGSIQDEKQLLLSGITVILPEYDLRDTTDSTGRFMFTVRDAPKEKAVELRLMQDGRLLDWKEVALGNSACNFILRDRQ